MTPAELRSLANAAEYDLQYGESRPDTQRALVAASRRLADIQEAWLNPGPRPDYHEHVKGFTRRRWPTLTDAIERSLA